LGADTVTLYSLSVKNSSGSSSSSSSSSKSFSNKFSLTSIWLAQLPPGSGPRHVVVSKSKSKSMSKSKSKSKSSSENERERQDNYDEKEENLDQLVCYVSLELGMFWICSSSK